MTSENVLFLNHCKIHIHTFISTEKNEQEKVDNRLTRVKGRATEQGIKIIGKGYSGFILDILKYKQELLNY